VITQDTLSSGNAIPTSPGMMGGYPATTNVYKFKCETDIVERLAARKMPTDIAEVNGREVTLQLRQENFQQQPGDVYAVTWSAAGGYGDPLEREPERVREDVIDNRSVSLAAAREIYGVVLTADGVVDAVATRLLRSGRREANRKKERVAHLDGEVALRVTDNLDLRREKGGLQLACSKCAASLGPAGGNYKDQCVRRESDISTANPNIGDYRRYIDDRPVFRQFFCPGCGALIENEVALAEDPVLHDIELHVVAWGERERTPGSRVSRSALNPGYARFRGDDDK
jgi:N-methylhydantoinase B